MEMWFIFLAGGLFLLGIMVYVLFMVFLPEWVGITGKKALEAERSHQGHGQGHDQGDGAAPNPDADPDIGPASHILNRMESRSNVKKKEN